MRHARRLPAALTLTASFLIIGRAHAADPTEPLYWSAEKTQDIMRDAAARVTKETGLSPQRFGDSMFLMHRERTSEAETHAESAD